MKKTLFRMLTTLLVLFILVIGALFFFQEKLIFFPDKLPKDFKFSFTQKFEEIFIETNDHIRLNGILFKSDNTKGVIFYLHGNAGSLESWGELAKTYTDLNYDVFILDYRGYGKSEGFISGQEQVFQDLQIAYSDLKKRYNEDKIIILGYSIGTGPATKIASTNKPKMLILQAPYYSLIDMAGKKYPFIPKFALKYKFETNKYIKDCKMPIVIFHGNEDEVIYYGSSLKLKELLKPQDTLITLYRQGHNGITENTEYIEKITRILK